MNYIELDVCESTNNELYSLALNGAQEGTVVVARRQTGGKGTKGRSFASPENGIYMSVLLRGVPRETMLDVTPLAAVVVKQALDKLCNISTKIKPVNDIYLDGKKICGILAQANSSNGETNFIIVGIGINLSKPEGGFPPELKDIAGYIKEEPDENLRKNIIEEIAKNLVASSKLLADEKFKIGMYDFYNSNQITL